MTDFLQQLNDNQREAVLYDAGPSLVVAGAGSGKTRVLTYKIIHLLQSGYQPHSILALTFTNKAAREMKDRIASITDHYLTRYLWMGTFHSIFYRILRREAQHIGYPSDFTIYDASDSKNLIKSIIKEMQLNDKIYKPATIQSRISNAKNALVTAKAYAADADIMQYDERCKVPLTAEIYNKYQNRCVKAGAMDFDELLLQTNILFRDNPAVLDKYRRQFRYVLVDEYQDTNFAQHLIVRRLSEQHQRIFVVGDDAQSIYSFRGANIDNMLRFKDNFPTCRLFKLEQNYRSTQNIVDAANSLIKKNTGQIPKTVFSENEKGSRIQVLSSYSDYEEAYLIASKIIEMMDGGKYKASDFAVLYRTNAQSRVLEEAMRKRMLNYRIYGSQSFYQRKEIKDIIAYLRVIINPHDEEALRRIINYPARGIGETTVNKLISAANNADASLWEVISVPANFNLQINSGTLNKIGTFYQMFRDFRLQSAEMSVSEIAGYVVRNSGILADLDGDLTVEGMSRKENVQELLRAMSEFVTMRREEGNDNISLADFLQEVSLMTDMDNQKDDKADKITLMTVHAAKGLEFDNVIVAGMEDDLFPSMRAKDNPRDIEEERRLFYVAITRAKDNCFITYAKTRFRNGAPCVSGPSFFINDIDRKFISFGRDVELPQRTAYITFRPNVTNAGWDSETEKNIEHETENFHPGDRVAHNKFGTGEIITLETANGDAMATILFRNAGTKKLLLKYAKLKKI
ncbi:MAG: UvrD-helicase domain-containing protein [Tannerella sp.]|jgi:DNA helicase-2/ATP-dependent DNA helicase PcrA|nr:UvrD-helicase domain-containing protein [Tannerella sp.]